MTKREKSQRTVNQRIKEFCNRWDHPDNLMHVKVFRSTSDAKRTIKLNGWPTRETKIRMFKCPEHKWANSHGNVIVIRFAETAGGYPYLFCNGEITLGYFHGLPK